MPIGQPSGAAPQRRTIGSGESTYVPTPAPAPSQAPSLAVPVAGVAGIGALAALLAGAMKSPSLAPTVSKALQAANAFRQQAMLSGYAPLKSILGNIGAGVEQAAEGKGLTALKEILSPATIKEAASLFKSGGGVTANPAGMSDIYELPKILSLPGRIMGATDQATRNALLRSGMSAKDAEAAVLQTPLSGSGWKTLENPVMRYAIPFRRTPFNQLFEGARKLDLATKGDPATLRAMGLYLPAGAVHGYATADTPYPKSVGFGAAASARYGVPYLVGAAIGRQLAGKSDVGPIVGQINPISEYGLSEAVTPKALYKPFVDPAALRVLQDILKTR